ncbi:hypothetical protein CEXT_43981 [Caerostris extrusa]|uniref:Uncharacterized protein n=1 Tax=Caerostris extrusa TaxID=172846 RepID=A0AAV4N967_CAEEX|nr:hypothetical protein CEXT_43981 [Caerostris extrusa]
MSVRKGGRGGWGVHSKAFSCCREGVQRGAGGEKLSNMERGKASRNLTYIRQRNFNFVPSLWNKFKRDSFKCIYTPHSPLPLHPHEEKRPPLFCMHMSECRNALPILGSGGAHQDSLKTKGGGGIGMGFKSLCRTHRVKRRSLHPLPLIHITFPNPSPTPHLPSNISFISEIYPYFGFLPFPPPIFFCPIFMLHLRVFYLPFPSLLLREGGINYLLLGFVTVTVTPLFCPTPHPRVTPCFTLSP